MNIQYVSIQKFDLTWKEMLFILQMEEDEGMKVELMIPSRPIRAFEVGLEFVSEYDCDDVTIIEGILSTQQAVALASRSDITKLFRRWSRKNKVGRKAIETEMNLEKLLPLKGRRIKLVVPKDYTKDPFYKTHPTTVRKKDMKSVWPAPKNGW